MRPRRVVGSCLGLNLSRMSEPHDGQEPEADLHLDLSLLRHDREIVPGGKTGKPWFFVRRDHHQIREKKIPASSFTNETEI